MGFVFIALNVRDGTESKYPLIVFLNIYVTLLLPHCSVDKTVSDFFQRCKCLYMYVHIFYYFSINWSDTSLAVGLSLRMVV